MWYAWKHGKVDSGDFFFVLVSPLNFCRKVRNFGNRVSIHVENFRFSFMDWWKSRTFSFLCVCVWGLGGAGLWVSRCGWYCAFSNEYAGGNLILVFLFLKKL